jgi:hypothetical protein
MTYGISPHLIPVTEDGKIKTKNHLEFLQLRKAREQYIQAGNYNLVDIPLHSDVLLGRGKPIQQHAGNLRLQAIVDEYVLEYHKLKSKHDKTALAQRVVRMVKTASARFLSKDNGIWMEVPDEVAREKVSGLFRTRYRTGYPKEASVKASMNNMKSTRPVSIQADINGSRGKRLKV